MALTNGLVVMTPSSVAKTGASSTATINADGSVTFGSCETLSLNGVFTSAYDNYMVSFRSIGTAANFPGVRLRASGVDESSASNYYTHQFLFASSTTVSGARSSNNIWFSYGNSTTLYGGMVQYIYGPYLAQPTAHRVVVSDPRDSASIADYAGTHSLSNSYDGFTFSFPSSGNSSGILTVFGFNQ
jgi:hypothetical protein